MARLASDVLDAFYAVACGKLDKVKLSWLNQSALVVVIASKGYPGSYEIGSEIKNISIAEEFDDVTVFHAGTKLLGNKVLSNGGRVLGVTALGNTIKDAQNKAYEAVNIIDWSQGFCRHDIGWRAVAKEPY